MVVQWELKEKRRKRGVGCCIYDAADTTRKRQLRLPTELVSIQV